MTPLWPFLLFLTMGQCARNLELTKKTRTTFLDKYETYMDVIVIHFQVPEDTLFASFKFVADEVHVSIFGCKPRNVSLYLKYKSLPVINPDGSKFPENIKNLTRSKLHSLQFLTDKKEQFVNFTTPEAGSYYVIASLAYSDPKFTPIKQQGLTAICFAFVDASLLIEKLDDPQIIVDSHEFHIEIPQNYSKFVKFFAPKSTERAILAVKKSKNDSILIRVQANSLPSQKNNFKTVKLYNDTQFVFETKQNCWHFIKFKAKNSVNVTIKLKFLPLVNTQKLHGNNLTDLISYKEIDLYRQSSTDSFSFSFELPQINATNNLFVNITSDEFIKLKFKLRDNIDIGGTLEYVMAFKPRLTKLKSERGKFQGEPENHTIVACIRNDDFEVPLWPQTCKFNDEFKSAPLMLNSRSDNATVLIPFPESGDWYVTLKLFCGQCEPCNCTEMCQIQYDDCVNGCIENCDLNCGNCTSNCIRDVVNKTDCKGCDCDGNCLRSDKEKCNSSVLFDLSSFSCSPNECGDNGKCMFMVSDGIVFSTCVCFNNYRGWDCSDGSWAHSYWLVVMELLLLVLSNLMFLPAVFIAYKRKYYIEAIVYFSICFFSTFYHACDAGENIINFCITRLNALQFADFFCALLSIWVTLIAIADLPSPTYYAGLFDIVGAIILAFLTTINKTSLWVFALPAFTGVLIISINWYLKYRKIKQLFLNKTYLFFYMPIGSIVVIIGLIIYGLLQTVNNYKYLHSMWHIIMATSIIILLPRQDTFQPETML